MHVAARRPPYGSTVGFEYAPAILQNSDEIGHFVGTEHGNAGLAEVGNALEDGAGGKMTTGVEDATILVDALHVDADRKSVV